MTDAEFPPRFSLAASLAETAALLPTLGRAMAAMSRGGVTHERIGPIESANIEGDILFLRGQMHDSRLDVASVTRCVIDRTGGMGGRVFPRLEFQAFDGSVLLSIVGMDGLEPFDAALTGRVGEVLEAPAPRTAPAGPRNAAAELGSVPADPGAAALEALRTSGGAVEIRFGAGPVSQAWAGVIEAVKPAMGFTNIIRSDFHLHLRDGTVAGFRPIANGVGVEALDATGTPIGLVLIPLDAEASQALAASGD